MKKAFYVFLTASLFVIGCNNDATVSTESNTDTANNKTTSSAEDKEERNKATAMAAIQGIQNHSAEEVMKHAADDVTNYGDGSFPPVKGKDSGMVELKSWLSAFPDVKGENLVAIADGDYVVVWGDWTGTWKGDFMGMKPTNKAFKVKDADIFKFNSDGKITEHHVVQHWAVVANQVGMKMQ